MSTFVAETSASGALIAAANLGLLLVVVAVAVYVVNQRLMDLPGGYRRFVVEALGILLVSVAVLVGGVYLLNGVA